MRKTNYIVAANKGVKGPPKTNGEKKADQMANSVEAMKLDDTPRSRSKNLDVLAEFGKKKAKNAANFVVIGRPLLNPLQIHTLINIRSRRCGQKYINGPSSLRS